MRIKRLEIAGFKSFVDRTVLTFPDPITAIVGPNGCGKSNIVDAVRWVMGEQSARHLRGRAMDDVVFGGSETRGPAGLAEVSVIFDAHALPGAAAPGGVPWGAVAPEEVVVTRRLFRGGESEYLLGGVPCRLRDIVDFFLGTGVGSKAYAIIEQGRIGFIVSSRPEDRRALIDEAAGITRYKSRKKLAERRIEATRQHLLRVSDIIGEIDTRLRSLRLQAAKAERYKRYKNELRDLDLWQAAHRYLALTADDKLQEGERSLIEEKHERETAAFRVEETGVEEERLAVAEELTLLGAAKDDLFALSNKAQLGAQRAQHHQAEAEALAGRATLGQRDIEDLQARAAEDGRTLADLVGQLEALDAAAEQTRRTWEDLEATHGEQRTALAETRRALEDASGRAASAAARTARLESEIEAARARAEDLSARIAALASEEAALEAEARRAGSEATGMAESLSAIKARDDELAGRRTAAEARAAQLRTELARGEMELETLREEAHRRRSRLESLREIQMRYESFQRGVRAIMRRAQSGVSGTATPAADLRQETPQDTVGAARPWIEAGGIRGLVADIVQPPPELETAVEAVLGERLGNIIVESHEVGVEAVEYLKAKSEGRSSFIPISLRARSPQVVYDATGGATLEAAPASPVHWPTGDGVRGPLLDLIGFDRRYDRVATHLLGDVLVVEDLRRALALWRETRCDKVIVTLDGDIIDPQGVVTGGSRDQAVVGVLGQKRELRELEEVMERLDADYKAALDRHLGVKQAAAEVAAQLDDLAAHLRQSDVARVTQEKDLDRLLRDRGQIEARREQLMSGRQELLATHRQNDERLVEAKAALEAEREVETDTAARIAELRSRTSALASAVESLAGELTEHKIAASQADERRRGARDSLERLRHAGAERQERRVRLEAQVAHDLEQAETLEGEGARLREEAALEQAEAEARAREHAHRQAAVEERSGLLARREADLRGRRASVGALAQALSELQLRCHETRLRLSSLQEQVDDRYRGVRLADVVGEYHLRPPCGEAQERRGQELRDLIERMGEINLTAIEESADLAKRYDFLSAQKADLESAIARLETAIERINRASRKRFREVFDAVNTKFQEVFPRLFGGGRAYLQLTDDSDMLETGVDIAANPPGKKALANIELLSGGEKALTAVSLLFAIFLIKPSPFCILDEVDAPLDDANVGRFNHALREMTDRSQFVIVTHNRRSMENADRLCGVTMEEPGVSKLVGVNLRSGKPGGPPVSTDAV